LTAYLIIQEENFLHFRIYRNIGKVPDTADGIRELISDGILRTMTALDMKPGGTVLNL